MLHTDPLFQLTEVNRERFPACAQKHSHNLTQIVPVMTLYYFIGISDYMGNLLSETKTIC